MNWKLIGKIGIFIWIIWAFFALVGSYGNYSYPISIYTLFSQFIVSLIWFFFLIVPLYKYSFNKN